MTPCFASVPSEKSISASVSTNKRSLQDVVIGVELAWIAKPDSTTLCLAAVGNSKVCLNTNCNDSDHLRERSVVISKPSVVVLEPFSSSAGEPLAFQDVFLDVSGWAESDVLTLIDFRAPPGVNWASALQWLKVHKGDDDIGKLLNVFFKEKNNPLKTKNREISGYNEKVCENTGNLPHESLEYPPLYYILKHCPWLLRNIKSLYRFRWSTSYPLQKRVPLSKKLRKMGIFVTWGELLLLFPFIGFILWGVLTSLLKPSVTRSGQMARTPLALAFITATHNSFVTLLLGMPFERAIFYHKLAGRVAFINGMLHTYAAFFHIDDEYKSAQSLQSFIDFTVDGQINASGTLLLLFITAMILTSMPYVRHKIFELFYYLHIIFAICMVVCAFCHSGTTVVILASIVWGFDLLIRKLIMSRMLYPARANVEILTDTVVEISFAKTATFNYNPGQYVFLSIPEISLFQWHPFSISSSPHMDKVKLHIRRRGNWTEALFKLAQKKKRISILFEGPYGSLGVDLTSDRYKMVMLISGGIGVTPMQSITHQLMHEHQEYGRDLKKVWFLWSARDPLMMQNMEIVRRHSTRQISVQPTDIEEGKTLTETPKFPSRTSQLAVTLLTQVPVSYEADAEIEEQYPLDEYLGEDGDDNEEQIEAIHDKESLRYETDSEDGGERNEIIIEPTISPNSSVDAKTATQLKNPMKKDKGLQSSGETSSFVPRLNRGGNHLKLPTSIKSMDSSGRTASTSTGGIDCAKAHVDTSEFEANNEILELKVFLTGEKDGLPYDFVSRGRPDIKKLFLDFRREAIVRGERRVAVCVCAPTRMVQVCRRACVKFSNRQVRFDFHSEVFD